MNIAIITGVSGTLGQALVSAFVRRSDTDIVYALSREASPTADSSKVRHLSLRSGIVGVAQRLMDELEQVPLNEIHIVHAAGQYEKTPLLTEGGDPSLFKQHFDVHVFLIYELISSLVPLIRSAQQTALITISTNLTERANRDSYGYIASKAALESLTKQFAFNLGQYNFQSNCLCPGYFLSNMNGFNEEIEERVMDNSPTGKRLTPEQLARAIVALFHADFHGLTGAKIQFDGGNTLGF